MRRRDGRRPESTQGRGWSPGPAKPLGIKAIHFWHLEPQDGKTLARTEESFEGLVVRLLRRSVQKTLGRALADGLRYLKSEVEGRASQRVSPRAPIPARARGAGSARLLGAPIDRYPGTPG